MTKNEIKNAMTKCEMNLKSYAMTCEALNNLKNNGEITRKVYDELNEINTKNFNKEFKKFQLLKELLELEEAE